jgi:hypothetical protein
MTSINQAKLWSLRNKENTHTHKFKVNREKDSVLLHSECLISSIERWWYRVVSILGET